VRFLVLHVPHLIPAVFALWLLGRLALSSARQPPADLDHDELAAWRRLQAERAYARRVPRRVARLGVLALAPLLGAVGTGIALYALALDDARPSSALTWSHAALSLAALALVTVKVVASGAQRLRRGLDARRAFGEGASLLLTAFGLPLLATGALLLASPSSSSVGADVHVVASLWWTVLLGVHLARYLGRSLDAALRGRAAPEPAPASRRPAALR
jgi:hypothetical protein